MSVAAMQRIVGTAIVDQDFREDLLNGRRQETIAAFALTPEEHRAIMTIRAQTLHEFAEALDHWLTNQVSTGAIPSAMSGAIY